MGSGFAAVQRPGMTAGLDPPPAGWPDKRNKAEEAMLEKRIERLDPALDRIIDTSEPIHDLADGYGGEQGPAEGPLWWKESGYLLFSDIHNNKRMKYEPGKGVSLFLDGTNRANGLTRDLQGPDRLRARQPPRHPAGTRRQPDRHRQQLSGPPTQPAERCRRQVRRLHLFHRSVDQPQRAEPMGPDLLRRLPADPRSRHLVAAGR